MTVLILVAFATLFISAMCSLLEATLYSVRSASLEASLAQGRHKRAAELFLGMRRNVAEPTSAILILNTVANTAGAAVLGWLAAREFGPTAVVVFSGLLTVGILLFSEILPKTYGAVHWRQLWPWVVWPLVSMLTILKPFVWLTERFASFVTGGRGSQSTTEDEVLATIQMGARHGALTDNELRLLTAVFLFDETLVRDVLIPRPEVAALDADWPMSRCLDVIRDSKHSRYPLFKETLDDAMGLLHVKDLIGLAADDSPPRHLARPLLHVPETKPVSDLMRQMQASKHHMALVHDERGTVVGAVTLENLVELIVGAVQDEFDEEEPEWAMESPGVYRLSGQMPLARIDNELDLKLDDPGVDTVAGLVIKELGRLAKVGDEVEVEGATVEVLEVKGFRSSSVRLVMTDEDPEEEGERAGQDGQANNPSAAAED